MYILLLAGFILLGIAYLLFKANSRLNIYCTSIIIVLMYILVSYYLNRLFDFNLMVLSSYLLLSMLVIIAFILYLFWDSKKLLKNEGSRLTNYLSLSLAMWIVILIALFPVSFIVNNDVSKYIFVTYLFTTLIFTYFFGLILSCWLLAIFYSTLNSNKSIDIFLVLGSGLINNKVTPLLASRINAGLEIYQKQNNKQHLFLVSGGQGDDELRPESVAMKEYLVDKGIVEDEIICEQQSKTTYENLYFSKEMIENLPLNKPNILICTNDFHILRAMFLAKKLHFKNFYSVGSKTKSYFFTNAFIREVIAIIKMDWWFHLVIMLASIAWYILTMVNI